MDLQYLRRLVKIFDDSSAADLEIEEEGTKIKLSKVSEHAPEQQVIHVQSPAAMPAQAPMVAPAPAATPAPAAESSQAEAPAASSNTHEILSPIVGTFYRAPAPDADPFASVGDTISAGQTLCIVEAMKLMNEIESDVSGKIVKVLVENGQPVEYNQPLFAVELS